MTLKVKHSVELTIDKDCNIGEFKRLLSDYFIPDSATIGVIVQKADRPYNLDAYYVRLTW